MKIIGKLDWFLACPRLRWPWYFKRNKGFQPLFLLRLWWSRWTRCERCGRRFNSVFDGIKGTADWCSEECLAAAKEGK